MKIFTLISSTFQVNSLKAIVTFMFSIAIVSLVNAQEICDNGIDDDGDGLVDCADPDCEGDSNCNDTFACSSDLYQVTSGTLKVLDPSTGTYTSIGTDVSYNGTGYNVQDGYIYGILGGNPDLVRINNQGQMTVIGPISNFTGLTYSGDFDLDGNWLSFNKSGSAWKMGSLDVDVLPLVMNDYAVTDLSTTVNAVACADISYNSFTGKYYGCSNGVIVEFDPVNKTVRGLADFSAVAESGGYGAAWSDIEGNSYFFNNATGNIYRAAFEENGTIREFSFIAVSEPNGNNDGMSCPLSNPPVFPEICSNGIDDDGDGLIDCDDPDCTLSTDCGEICDNGIDDDGDGFIDGADSECNVSSGSNGGLESNRRLSNLISKRNYKKTILAPTKLRKIDNSTKANGYLANFIPLNLIEGADLYDASPNDLIGITNAIDIYSTDVVTQDRRIASILAIQTENEVYEHTKYICDRLDGGVINDLKNIEIFGNTFVVSEIIQPSGNVDYAITFNIYPNENGQFHIESHWNLDQYSSANTILNFQLWANDLTVAQEIAEKILENTNEMGQITYVNSSAAPGVYVSTGRYENGKLHLRIKNNQRATQFSFEGSFTKTETGTVEIFEGQKNTYGHAEENITLNVGSIYDVGFRIQNNASTTVDDLFFADGAWGLDDADGFVSSFDIFHNNNTNVSNNELLISRNVQFEAENAEVVTIYRGLTPKFNPKNLSAFNNLSMDITGAGTLELTIVKSSIENWENQYRVNFDLEEEKKNYVMTTADFVSEASSEPIDLSDVQMLIFKFYPTKQSENMSIVVEEIIFGYNDNAISNINNQTNTQGFGNALDKSYCYPNPASNNTQLYFEMENDLDYTFTLSNNLGQVVKTFKQSATKGLNVVDLELDNFNNGLYYYSISTNTLENFKGKVIIAQ